MTLSSPPIALPSWAADLVTLYEGGGIDQFILHGNVADRMVLPVPPRPVLGNLQQFLLDVLMPRFDVVLSYDLGNGVRIVKGGQTFTKWPNYREGEPLPKSPRAAVEFLTHYFRYTANLARLPGGGRVQVGCVINSAHLVAPALPGALSYDLNALALLMRDWSSDVLLAGHTLATFLVTENLNDLHPLIVNNTRAAQVKVPLPTPGDLNAALGLLEPEARTALSGYAGKLDEVAQQLAGATLGSIESLLRTREYKRQPVTPGDLVGLKKQLIERDANGLIEFVKPDRSLDDLHGQDKIKQWIRQDIALWRSNDLQAMPMGYLLCGPVGTGKTYMVECIAGEAGYPVVKLKNFRDKWVGSTESNLEKIFRLLQALGRCFVFVDEADQALGRRDAGPNDSGVSGRVYQMMAEEMSNTRNRGKIVWILASSRPDLIEVDLKRPGRIDVKIPIFPTTTAEEGFALLRALCKRRGVEIPAEQFAALRELIPDLLTPGAAEAIAVKTYRLSRTSTLDASAALRECLTGYQHPVPAATMDFQIGLAVAEATDRAFVPEALRARFP